MFKSLHYSNLWFSNLPSTYKHCNPITYNAYIVVSKSEDCKVKNQIYFNVTQMGLWEPDGCRHRVGWSIPLYQTTCLLH